MNNFVSTFSSDFKANNSCAKQQCINCISSKVALFDTFKTKQKKELWTFNLKWETKIITTKVLELLPMRPNKYVS